MTTLLSQEYLAALDNLLQTFIMIRQETNGLSTNKNTSDQKQSISQTTTTNKKKVIQYAVVGSITAATIAGAAIEAIVGYIAVYFFAPAWKKIARTWEEKKRDEQNTD